MTIRFWISSSVSEIFAAELWSRPKSGQILHVFRPRNFFRVRPPKILDQHYKIWPSTDHRAKFHAGRPTHLGDFASGKKINKKKTSEVKLKSAPQAIAFGRTNEHTTYSSEAVMPLVNDVSIVLIVELIGKVCTAAGCTEDRYEAREVAALLHSVTIQCKCQSVQCHINICRRQFTSS